MSELYSLVEGTVQEIKEKYTSAAEDGVITIPEGLSLGSVAVTELMTIYRHVSGHGSRKERIDCMVEAAEQLFDDVIVPYDLPIPDFFEKWGERAARPYIRPMIEALFGGIEDQLEMIRGDAKPEEEIDTEEE